MKYILIMLALSLTACATEQPIPGLYDEFEEFEQMDSGNMNIKIYVRKNSIKRAPAGAIQKDEK